MVDVVLGLYSYNCHHPAIAQAQQT